MKRIAVGVDGSACSMAALRWAGLVAAATDAELWALHALRGAAEGRSPAEHEHLVAMRREALAGEWTAAAVAPGVACHTDLREGDPRDVLLSFADDRHADLVVVGRSGAGGGPGFLHVGSVAEHAIHHAAVPLAVIPTDLGPRLSRIAVGVDGSAASKRALGWATELASAARASLVVIGVHEPIVEWTPAPSAENWRRDVEAELASLAKPAADRGIAVDVVAQREIHPAEGLLGAAAVQGADLVVIGTRGLGGFSGLRAGGVTLKVLHRAALPLVVVPVA